MRTLDNLTPILQRLTILIVSFALYGNERVFSQKKMTVTDYGSGSVRSRTYTEIPEATEPGTPVELEWWQSIRRAGNELQKKEKQKSATVFALLFSEGFQKAYRVPLKGRPPQVLISRKLNFPVLTQGLPMRQRLNGTIRFSLEYRADGSIGEVKLLSGINKKMDEYAIRTARESIFLPAIKDGRFVTQWGEVVVGFFTDQRF